MTFFYVDCIYWSRGCHQCQYFSARRYTCNIHPVIGFQKSLPRYSSVAFNGAFCMIKLLWSCANRCTSRRSVSYLLLSLYIYIYIYKLFWFHMPPWCVSSNRRVISQNNPHRKRAWPILLLYLMEYKDNILIIVRQPREWAVRFVIVSHWGS